MKMKILLIVLVSIIALSGCAGKGLKVDYVDLEGKDVSISTDYQIENGFKMERNPDGYVIELGSATTKDAEFGLIAAMMQMMMQMMAAGYVPPVPSE
jgi:uncharacterized lipoprotein YehR (DUF1307 family)